MANFERQLRDLSESQFEIFVHQYLVANFPGAEIKRVDGSGGDGGIDSFSGVLTSGPAIWQCKHFAERIRKKQKEQILHSIETAFRHGEPSLWTLCVPIDLRTIEHNWFQEEIVAPYGGPGRIKLLQGSDFVSELLHNRPLRDYFFPESALSEIRALRETATAGLERMPRESNNLLLELAEQYLSGKMDLEPRLTPIIEMGGRPTERSFNQRPGLVMSIHEAGRTVHFFARDPLAFNLDPIKVTADLGAVTQAAMKEALDLGRSVSVGAGKILGLTSSSPLLNSFLAQTDLSQVALELQPYLPEPIASRIFPMRFVAGTGHSAKELFYIPFKAVRIGRREIALSSQSVLPMEISVILGMSQHAGASVSFRPIMPGADIQQLHEVLEFLEELEHSGTLQVSSLETNVRLLNQDSGAFKSNLDIPKWVRSMISDAALVAQHLRVPLKLPAKVTEKDATELRRLAIIFGGTEFFGADLNCDLTLRDDRRKAILECVDHPGFPVRADLPSGWRIFEAFGRQIDPGPLRLFAEKARFEDGETVRQFCQEAKDGDSISVKFRCDGPCRWERPREWDQMSAFTSGNSSRPMTFVIDS